MPEPTTDSSSYRQGGGGPTPPVDGGAALLDWNESPLGPSPVAVARVCAHAKQLHRYPRGLVEAVTGRVAADLGVPPERVLLTNGVDEAADLLMVGASEAWSVLPGFFGYPDRARALGVTPRTITLDAAWEPQCAPEELSGAGPVFLAQPHNPTGSFFDPTWVTEVIRRAALVCLDATYAEFAESFPVDPAAAGRSIAEAVLAPGIDRTVVAEAMAEGRLAVFHSFSKSHGLAGLRVGALVAAPELTAQLRDRQRAYTVDTVALHALDGSLADLAHRRALRAHIRMMRPRFAAVLRDCPLLSDVRTTDANYVLARGADTAATSALVARLAARGVWISDGDVLGLPGWLRVSLGDEEALAKFSSALDAESAEPTTLTELGGSIR